MKILYSAIDQTVPGTKGGSVHVAAVAEGLAGLGHEVTALITPGADSPRPSPVRWVPMAPPLGSTHLRLARSRAIERLAREVGPDFIIERYHNFGGEAIRLGKILRVKTVLEVNAPLVDHPRSKKAFLDRVLLLQPMRRWRESLARAADLIVTPHPGILPPDIAPAKVLVLEWGADTDRFQPHASGGVPFARPAAATVAVFAGAFRSWHGAVNLVRAIKALHARGSRDFGAVLIGDGPELSRLRAEAAGTTGIVLPGAVAHESMPAALAAADIGVAPFEVGAHGPLALGFYWSPLKVFEYMAAGLPVVAPAIDRIPSLVEHAREGVLYDPTTPGALAAALESLADPLVRARLGAAARRRAEQQYSWAAHCRALEAAMLRTLAREPQP